MMAFVSPLWLLALASVVDGLNVSEFRQSCGTSFRHCQPSQCTPRPKLLGSGLVQGASYLGRGYDSTKDRGEGNVAVPIQNQVFEFTYCTADSLSASPPSAPVALPCEAQFDAYDPPIIDWNRGIRMFSSVEQYSRQRALKIGVTGEYDGATGMVAASSKAATTKLLAAQNYVALNNRKVLYSTVTVGDWRCYPFTPSFLNHVYSLNPTNHTHVSYANILDRYGDHVITSVDYGGRAVHTATVGKCKASVSEGQSSSLSVQLSAYDALGKAIQGKLGVHFNSSANSGVEDHVDDTRAVYIGGDMSLADEDGTFFDYVASVQSNPGTISVTEDNSLTPLFELLSGNINLFVNNTYNASHWKQVRSNLQKAIQLRVIAAASAVKEDMLSCPVPTLPSSTSTSVSDDELFFLFFLVLVLGVVGAVLLYRKYVDNVSFSPFKVTWN